MSSSTLPLEAAALSNTPLLKKHKEAPEYRSANLAANFSSLSVNSTQSSPNSYIGAADDSQLTAQLLNDSVTTPRKRSIKGDRVLI